MPDLRRAAGTPDALDLTTLDRRPLTDERTVRVAVPGPDARARTDFPLVATADGTVLARPSVPFSAALSARTDGVWAIRDTYNRSFEKEPPHPAQHADLRP